MKPVGLGERVLGTRGGDGRVEAQSSGVPFRWASRFFPTVQNIKNITRTHSGPGKREADAERQVRGSRWGAMQGFQSGNGMENFNQRSSRDKTPVAYPKGNFCPIRVFQISHGSWEGIPAGRDMAPGPVCLQGVIYEYALWRELLHSRYRLQTVRSTHLIERFCCLTGGNRLLLTSSRAGAGGGVRAALRGPELLGAGGFEDPQTPPPPSLITQVLPASAPLKLATAPLAAALGAGHAQCLQVAGGPLGIHAAEAGLDCHTQGLGLGGRVDLAWNRVGRKHVMSTRWHQSPPPTVLSPQEARHRPGHPKQCVH